jgi:hypothetical protein
MPRPFRDLTNDELGAEFAACCQLGGRPRSQWRGQIAYADLVMDTLLDEYRSRDYEAQAAAEALTVDAAGHVDE